MRTPDSPISIREKIGYLNIEYWRPDPKRGATEGVFYINTQDKEVFDLFNQACQAIDKSKVKIEGMRQPLVLFHQIGPHNKIGETGYENMGENIPMGSHPKVFAIIREKMLELSGK